MVNHLHRTLYVSLGGISLILGVIGIFVPLLPTTPFILLAAYFFSRSSETLHSWLLSHHLFGHLIEQWEAHGVIPLKVKWIATASIIVMVSYPIYAIIPILWMKIITVVCICCVLLFIWTRPSCAPHEDKL